MNLRLLAVTFAVASLIWSASVRAEDAADPKATNPLAAKLSFGVLVGHTQIHSSKYNNLTDVYFAEKSSAHTLFDFRFATIPDLRDSHWGLTLDLTSVDSEEKENYAGGTLKVRYDQGAFLVGAMRYFSISEGIFCNLNFNVGLKVGISSSRISVSSPTGDVTYPASSELVGQVAIGALYPIWQALHIDADLVIGSQTTALLGVGYAL